MPRSPDFRYDVFLSHNTGDKPRVRRLAERLKKAGLRVWFDEWVIRPGDDIYLAIESGLEAATREQDTQTQERILIGHMMAVCGEADQIFRPAKLFEYGIDGEVEFKDNDGRASGNKIYVQLKSGDSYLRTRKADGSEVFDVKDESHLEYWISQPVDGYLVIRQKDETSGQEIIRWMNVARYLKNRKDKKLPSHL